MMAELPSTWLLVEAALVASLPWPFLSAVWRRQTRRRDVPLRPVRLGALASVSWSGLAVLASSLAPALHAMAAVGLVGVAAWWWRQRPQYGRHRGLPPGSLRPFEASLWRDDLALRDRAQRHGAIFKMSPALEPFVCVVGHERGRALLREHGDALRSRPWAAASEISGGFLRFMSGEAHRQARHLVGAALRADLVAANEPELRQICRSGLTQLAASESVAQRLALRDLSERWLALLLLGMADGDPRLDRLRATFPAPEGIDRTPLIGGCRPGGVANCLAILRAGDTRSVSASCAVTRIIDASGAEPDDAVLGNLVMMLQIGAYDLSSLMRWILHYVALHPTILARQRQAAAAGDRSGFARACVLETLRLDQAEALMRTAAEDIAFGGFHIPRGWAVRICLREVHRDPALFERADEFVPDRFLPDPPPPAAYAPFGLGGHACIAADLVVQLAGLFVEELAAGYELVGAVEAPRVFGAYHWEPGPGFSVDIRPAATPA